ncbi:MAG: HNH endonuclease [Terriglobales bacterium]
MTLSPRPFSSTNSWPRKRHSELAGPEKAELRPPSRATNSEQNLITLCSTCHTTVHHGTHNLGIE